MKRMQGFNTLWMPGTDHAGIATQAVVERRLLEEKKQTRHDLGKTTQESREKLVEIIWQWKEQYEKRIIGQLKQLGASCDWQRLRFTLDEQCARAVRETFFRLFQDGKIYRGKRLVNWDTYLQTAVSDDEVFKEPVKGHFWHFKYPVIEPKPGEPTHVTIATTRPETMLGDTAVAVHPDPAAAFDKVSTDLRERMLVATGKDREALNEQATLLLERRARMLPQLEKLRDMAKRGVKLRLPLAEREIPLIADEWAKPELGSGAVKITPAHDENDYAVWQRHPEIGAVCIMDRDGTIGISDKKGRSLVNEFGISVTPALPEKYYGLKMHTTARAAVIADMEAVGLFNPETDREDREIELPHSDRSKTPIEPYLADQWFVKMDDESNGPGSCKSGLAQSAMDAVSDGRVRITPERYAKTYLDWLSEKRDWPVGRQLWWGHRIPVWSVMAFSEDNFGPMPAETLKQTIRSYMQRAGVASDEFAISSANYAGTPEAMTLVCTKTEQADKELEILRAYLEHIFQSAGSETGTNGIAPTRAVEDTLREFVHDAKGSLLSLSQDEEVLDTWFSSALWPHSTLGWPEQTSELATFYPTSTLVTSRDIITLWVARMVLTGLYNLQKDGRSPEKAIPFRDVYIHPKILDGYGETMSKSKGNGVDPLDVIDKFGADALRFGLAYMATETQDVRMPVEFECPHCQAIIPQTKKNRTLPRVECEKCGKPFSTQWAESHGTDADKALPRGAVVSERFELGRRFANKLWNASRFSLMNLEGYKAGDGIAGPGATTGQTMPDAKTGHTMPGFLLEDRWILSRLATVTGEVTAALETFKFADASRLLYAFAWNDFCDYYVEMTKARFAHVEEPLRGSKSPLGERQPRDREMAQRVLAFVLDQLLRLLHPIVPFLTEEVWQLLGKAAPLRSLTLPARPAEESVCIAAWPVADKTAIDASIEQQFADFQAVLGAVRELRMAQNIPPREPVEFRVRCDEMTAKLLEPMQPYFTQMAKATSTGWGPKVTPPEAPATSQVSGARGPIEVHLDVSRFIDVDAEKARLTKQLEQLRGFVKSIDAKLANEAFVSRAPAEVVQQQRHTREEKVAQIASTEAALAKLATK
jgi:valyl-tRNA synthetase